METPKAGQWLGIHLPMWGTQMGPLVWKMPQPSAQASLHHGEEQPPLAASRKTCEQQRPSAAKNKNKYIFFNKKEKVMEEHQDHPLPLL